MGTCTGRIKHPAKRAVKQLVRCGNVAHHVLQHRVRQVAGRRRAGGFVGAAGDGGACTRRSPGAGPGAASSVVKWV